MKTFIKTLLVAVTILFSVFATAKQVKLPNNIKYVNTTEAFSCTEIDGMNCQTKNQFNYKDNSYVFVLERGGAWCYDYTVSVVNLKTGWICPYISRHLLSLNPLQARCRRYSRGER